MNLSPANKLIASFIILLFILSSCMTISYTPWVSLDVSPTTINKSVVIEKFVDESPIEDTKNPFGGFAVTNKKALTQDFNTEVTRAIAADFSANAVFSDVRLKNDSADYKIKGVIKRFSGKNRPTNGVYSLFPTLGLSIFVFYSGIPFRVSTADIEIALSIYDKNNHLIATYNGIVKDKQRSNMYNDKTAATLSFVNKSFSKAISDIRTQIMKDISKYQ